MTFIEKSDKNKAAKMKDNLKSFRPAFRERQFGSEFNQWELNLLKDFNYAKNSRKPCISGCTVYDRSLGVGRFLLIPAAHLPQDYAICECPPDIPVPANLSYVTITGTKKIFFDYWEIFVEKIAFSELKVPIKPEITFSEFQDNLFAKWGGILSPVRELLAFEFVSTPPLLNQVGGLSVTLYDGTQRKEANKLLRYLKGIMPLDIALGKSGSLAIPELAANQPLSPFSWRFRCFDADKPLNQQLSSFLDKRRSKRFSEVSVGLGSKRNQPKSIYDPPLTRVDQPTLLPDSTEMLKINNDTPLEAIKYLITMKMLFPTVGKTQTDLETTLERASQKLIKTAERFDIPQAVRRHGLFDSNFYGKPQSIVRLALASARSQQRLTADNDYISHVFESYYLKNTEMIMESWDELMTPKGVEIISLNEFDRQVLKFITGKENKDFGVSFSQLCERFPDEYEVRASVDRLSKDNVGKIYEARHDIFRSVPFE